VNGFTLDRSRQRRKRLAFICYFHCIFRFSWVGVTEPPTIHDYDPLDVLTSLASFRESPASSDYQRGPDLRRVLTYCTGAVGL
jgi:hypothetical protein